MAGAALAVNVLGKLWIGNREFAGQVILEVDMVFQDWPSCGDADGN
jgi:hypothetical protein